MYQHLMKLASRNRRKKKKELSGKSLHNIKKINFCMFTAEYFKTFGF